MKRSISMLAFIGMLCCFSVSEATLSDAWISFNSSYLGGNVYEHSYTWGASSTLSQEEIDNLFPYENWIYTRVYTGIGTQDNFFHINWTTPVDIIFMSTIGTVYPAYANGVTGLSDDDIFGDWWDWTDWKRNRKFSFRTKGYTGMQDIALNIDYFGWYTLNPGENFRPFYSETAGTPLRVTGSFGVVPEPASLFLFGSGFLSLLGLTSLYAKKKANRK
ncbi:MAG: PEP-CTERM sorting domain-containing protein [candidate division Zixibacteria bacterium]|nr:PEP-CTERM sorting domain-containing protein [candidate division Zixibacteria bacterium]